jgi:selenocysteine lyase/cysteine desulfurase
VFPIKELCALARTKGVISLVGGAQVLGHVMLNISNN